MIVKWNSGKVLDEYEKKQEQFLIGAGHIMVNQMTDLTHVITGLLKNSIIFHLKNGQKSNFGSEGTGRPKTDDEVSKSESENYVRIGSAVVYAGAYEKHTGTFSKAIDQVISDKSLLKLAKKIF